MQRVLFLHGAIGASDQLSDIANSLSDTYDVHRFDFAGHGGKPFPEEPLSIKLFADEVLNFLNEKGIDKVSIFGYSMGGYVAMMLAKHHPERVEKIVTLATKFHWDEPTAAKETKMLQADKIEEKVPAFAKALAERHAPNDWKELFIRTIDMLNAMGQDNPLKLEDYSNIETPSLILLGDRDKMITLEETLNVYKTLPNAQMGMLPNTHHPIEQANIPHLLFHIRQFFG
ncbi:MAG: alpha/beta hydrolase [Chitinophagales bacterium]|nr:alpha/beta hydrolase [Chitinophagaceae bacterium]MCB9064463.1 alpha/beta hydrolase [Chitinophagales bacterium]